MSGTSPDDFVIDLAVAASVFALDGDAPLVGGVKVIDHGLQDLLAITGVLVPVGNYLPAGVQLFQVAVELLLVLGARPATGDNQHRAHHDNQPDQQVTFLHPFTSIGLFCG
jgi:hypothetical protein